MKPKCILVTGRPGAGKSTLTELLSKRMYLPKLSRDEIKEGYVNTFGVKHDMLPENTNGVVNQVFFKTILNLLEGNVSIIIEAAFQHALWDYVVPDIMKIANLYIVICDLDAEQSARRHLERGMSNPKREFYHGDKRVAIFRETGVLQPGGEYLPPDYDVPTFKVSTEDGYSPSIEDLEQYIINRN